jgi:hypothetical protein
MEIPKEWLMIDSSKLQDFMSCPRSYLFRHLLGWDRDEPSIHLEFGKAMHKLMEVIYKEGSKPNFSPENLALAYKAFEDYYRPIFPPEADDENAPKIPSNVLTAIPIYAARYNRQDTFDVLYTEVAGTVAINEESGVLYFRLDTIVRRSDNTISSLEHKTGSRFSRTWADQWMKKTQIGTYQHVLHCMFPNDNVYGCTVNGIFVKDPPKLKKDGTPYANSTETDFFRIPCGKSLEQMDSWLETTGFWYDWLTESTKEVIESIEKGDPISYPFPENPESCTKYFGCRYRDYCGAWSNPLKRAIDLGMMDDTSPPSGFEREYWNPAELQKEAKKVVEL